MVGVGSGFGRACAFDKVHQALQIRGVTASADDDKIGQPYRCDQAFRGPRVDFIIQRPALRVIFGKSIGHCIHRLVFLMMSAACIGSSSCIKWP